MNPRESAYKMPAEWQRHTCTFISWPVADSMVYPQDYAAVCNGYEEIIRAIAEFEPVTVIVNPDDLEQVRARLAGTQADCLPVPHNDAWLRDNGPTFLTRADGGLGAVNWGFNAWGGKYEPWDLDDQVAPAIIAHTGVTRFDAPLVMEGGSIHTDGEGTLLTTEECLLHPNRNPELDRDQITGLLRQYIDIDKIIWLKRGLSGDETDGHVDNVACFAAPGKIILQVCNDPEDANYAISQENLRILDSSVDAQGRKPEIIAIRQPPLRQYGGKRLTLSYLNFYFVNDGIILPVFGGDAAETDRLAEQALAAAFPGRRIRTVNGMAIIKEGGNVHCTTQQMPAPTHS
ncbi:MAG: agmatine deiminase [Paenibacillaceae bacterium]|jgi:agmatine deiminase|nr:agmatine deiminase [Paenibacillaceae bacterium]